jgi:hypothetical protein
MLLAMLLALVGAQDVPFPPQAKQDAPAKAADGSERWSILADPCAAATSNRDDIVVCGSTAAATPRLPLPAERGPPDRPMPSNGDLSGAGALAATASPCATLSQGCTTGVDIVGGATSVARLVGKAIDPDSCCEQPGEATNPVALVKDVGSAVGKIFRNKPDKSKRVPNLFDDLPAEEGRTP